MARLVEITEDECWELLGTQAVCRVGWAGSDGPMILPLNYVVHEQTLWLRTSAHSTLSQEIDDDQLAILVDQFDADTEVGWSVQVRGRAEVHYSLEGVPEDVQRLHTWAEGARPLWIKAVPSSVTGRRITDEA